MVSSQLANKSLKARFPQVFIKVIEDLEKQLKKIV